MYKMLDIQYQPHSNTIIDPMYGVLNYLKLISVDKDTFAGISSLAFRFSVNKELDYMSTFFYNWNENWLATDFIGIFTKMYSAYTDDVTFPLYQKNLLEKIKENVDFGIPSIIWKDGFVVVKGYDDENAALVYTDGQKDHVLQYSELGYSSFPMWGIQIFSTESIIMDEKELYFESIFQAVYKAHSQDPSLPKEQYACGLRVYDFIVDCLKQGELNEEQINTMRTFCTVKEHLCQYFLKIQPYMPELSKTTEYILRIKNLFKKIEESLHDSSYLQSISFYLEAKEIESLFYRELENIYHIEFHNRKNSIWLR